jgi:hypothetical protein
MLSVIGEVNFGWRMGPSSGFYIVSSSHVINSGSAVFRSGELRKVCDLGATAANSPVMTGLADRRKGAGDFFRSKFVWPFYSREAGGNNGFARRQSEPQDYECSGRRAQPGDDRIVHAAQESLEGEVAF